MNNTGDLMTINDINFQGHIEYDEARTDDFKIMYNQLNNICQRYVCMQLTRDTFFRLWSDVKQVVLEYKENHLDSTFKIRPDHVYAFESQQLTAKEIAELHKKHCDRHHEKKEYTYLDVGNMLFDLHTVGQIHAAADLSAYPLTMVCKTSVNVQVRIYDYI